MSKNQKLLIIDIFIVSIIIFCIGAYLIYNLPNTLRGYPENLIFVFSTFVSIFIGIIYFYIKYPFEISLLGFTSQYIRDTIIWGSIGGITLILINFPYSIVLGETDIPYDYFIEFEHGVLFISFYLLIAIILIPFAEEIFYRGFLFRIVKNDFGIFYGYFISTLLYWIGHNFSVLPVINSLVFCYVYEKSGRIGASIIAHSILNFGWYAAVYWKSSLLV